MADSQKKVFLWGNPRSLTTAVFRAMMSTPRTKAIYQPFREAFYFGRDRVYTITRQKVELKEHVSFQGAIDICEKHYPDYDVVFVKDMAKHLKAPLGMAAYIPRGYINTFLIRTPEKTIPSLYKMRETEGWTSFKDSPVQPGFKELFELFEIITEQLGHPPIVIDSDDLLEDPEAMLRLYCQKVGISFHENMLNWSEIPDEYDVFTSFRSYYFKQVTTTNTFMKPKPPMKEPEPHPEEVQRVIDENIIYYNKLYEHRMKVAN